VDPAVAGELAWEPTPVPGATNGVVPLQAGDGGGGTSLWTGNVPLPQGQGALRVVIKEFELYPVAGTTGTPQRRLVYADAVEI
jgi:hypothetical protein